MTLRLELALSGDRRGRDRGREEREGARKGSREKECGRMEKDRKLPSHQI